MAFVTDESILSIEVFLIQECLYGECTLSHLQLE